jgi:hypothetical protein
MKKFLIVLGIVAFFLACVVIAKNQIIKSGVTMFVSKAIGAPVHMDSFSLNVLNSTIRISGFKIYNPGGFPEGVMVFCPEINIVYDRETLFKQKRRFLIMEVELKEMGLTKNKEGKLNVNSLKIMQAPDISQPVPLQIDLLNLRVGELVYKDYTKGPEPSVKVYQINQHKSYKGIPTLQQLAFLVRSELVKGAAIKNAEIYGVAVVTGVAILPVFVTAIFIGKDDVRQIIDVSFEHAYKVSLEVLKRMGSITKDDEANGAIKANIDGAMIALTLRKEADNKIQITISARKYMFPQLDIASGVLYQILDKLGKS